MKTRTTSPAVPGSIVALVALLAAGCSTGTPGEPEAFVVPPEKADNFLAATAQEYLIEGESTVTLEPEYADKSDLARRRRVHKLIPLKQIAIGWFLGQYLGPKDRSDPNYGYGGFHCLTKNGSYEDLDIRDTGDGLTWSFRFRQEIAGPVDLLEKLPTQRSENGERTFRLVIGKVSNEEMAQLTTNEEWYRNPPWDGFDPSRVDPALIEEIELTIRPEPRSLDAWIDYQRLFSDGEVTVAVHFGYDYHSQYHLQFSRDLYDWLVRRGFRSPVSSYESYTRTSGPLTRQFTANGRDLTARVWLYWPVAGTETDPDTDAGGIVLEDDMRASFRDKEVIVFNGHSGPFYGFALANWKKTLEGDLDDSEIPGLNMPPYVYQILLAEGCETYSLGQAFWDNPSKADRTSLDIITTTNYSNADSLGTVHLFLEALFGTDSSGEHKPPTYGELLGSMDDDSWWFHSMYGVHGLDDNPHLHPYADPDVFCMDCRYDKDCGTGHKCAWLNDEEKVCLGRCTANDGCPQGWKCMDIASGNVLEWKGCVPANMTCSVEAEPGDGPQVMLNEVLADPGFDANADGVIDSSGDEFVEIVNHGTTRIDLGGWTLSDLVGTRFEFPYGASLMAGEAALVFGGGDPRGDFGGSVVFVAEHGLGLNNTGDVVSLASADGIEIDWLSYGSEANHGRSLVREADANPDSSWIQHPGDDASPGTRQDGGSF